MMLDIGCGAEPVPGYQGVDRYPPFESERVTCFDACNGDPWPWATSSIEGLRCSHFIEHIPACDVYVGRRVSSMDRSRAPLWLDGLVFFFSEAFRVARPGALFEVIWPAFQSTRAFQDPTHRRFIPPELLDYLNAESREIGKLQFLGATCDWVLDEPVRAVPLKAGDANLTPERIAAEWNVLADYRAVLRARKGAP